MNVFGDPLEICNLNPITGAFRDGKCNTGPNDVGTHTVCAIVDKKFLEFSKSRGNDLTVDYPEYNFKGLKSGDRWCLCVSRWIEAYQHGCACKLILVTHIKTLEFVDLPTIKKFEKSRIYKYNHVN